MSELDLLRKIADLEARLARLESDDRTRYSTGTWTPSFTGTGTAGTFTYALQFGTYTRIGNRVIANAYCSISAISVAPTGDMVIAGLPFAAQNTTGNQGVCVFAYIENLDYPAGALQILGYLPANQSSVRMAYSVDNAALVAYPAANFTNASCTLGLTVIYSG